MKKNTRIYVAGHQGMVGTALVRTLESRGYSDLVLRRREDLDLTNQVQVQSFFAREMPEVVILAAARVGGINANNSYPVEFLTDNLSIAVNTIKAAYEHNVKRLLFLGSSCIYPRMAPQPISEDSLLSSELEKTNEAYALAKITGLKLCQYYRLQHGVLYHSAMPTNLYGPGDNYHLEDSHVLPALIRRFHEARLRGDNVVTIWGSGTPRREFLHTDDLAAAMLHLLDLENPPDWINVGTGKDIPIIDLARLISEIVGFQGAIQLDTGKPDGTPRKLLDISKIVDSGWKPAISLREGLIRTYQDFLAELAAGTARGV